MVQHIILCGGVPPGRLQLTSVRFQRHLAVSSGNREDLERVRVEFIFWGAATQPDTATNLPTIFAQVYNRQLRHVTRLCPEPWNLVCTPPAVLHVTRRRQTAGNPLRARAHRRVSCACKASTHRRIRCAQRRKWDNSANIHLPQNICTALYLRSPLIA